MEQEIVSYIKEARKHGLDDAVIKQNLLNAGWEAGAVEESFVYEKATQTGAPAAAAANAAGVVHAQVAQPLPARISIAAAPGITQTPPAAMPAQPAKKSHVRGIAAAAAALVIILGGASYAFFIYGFFNPAKVWQKFQQAPRGGVYQSTVKFSYADPGSFNSSTSLLTLRDVKLDINGDFYVNGSDPKNPQSSTTAEYTFSNSGTGLSTTFQYALIGKALYLNIGNNPILSLLKSGLTNGQNADWIKIDLSQLAGASSTPGSLSGQQLQNIFTPDFTGQLQKIWDSANVITVGKFDGLQKINGVETMHFQNQLDKQALKNAFTQTLTAITGALNKQGGNVSSQNVSDANFAVDAIIDKIQISDMETWVGATDFKLYQVHFASNAPSIVSAIQTLTGPGMMGAATPQIRDAARVANVREMANSLELYYNDNNGYPDAVSGVPNGITPGYLSATLAAPEPPDGSCTDYYNGYWYTPSGTKTVRNGVTVYSSYTLTFCLGGQTEGFAPGIAKLTPAGIQAGIACPSSDQNQCINSNPAVPAAASIQDQISKIINGIGFNATVTVDATYHDYGKILPLTAPAGAYDISQKMPTAGTTNAQ